MAKTCHKVQGFYDFVLRYTNFLVMRENVTPCQHINTNVFIIDGVTSQINPSALSLLIDR